MKDKLFLILFLLWGYESMHAQEGSSFQFGIKAGGNLYSSSVDIKDDAAKKLKVGYQVGLSAEYAFTDDFYLQSGVFFVTKGIRLKGKSGVFEDESHLSQAIELQYLQLPVLATYKIELLTDTKVFFNAGPYIAYGIGGKTTTKYRYVNSTREDGRRKIDSFGDNRMKKFDYGFKYSIGLEFEKFLFEWSYELGFVDITDSDNEINLIFNNKHFRNQGLSLSAGYKF